MIFVAFASESQHIVVMQADHEYLPQEQQVLVLATECYQIIWGEGGSLLPLLGMNWRRHVPYYNQRLQDLLVCVLGGPIKLDVDLDQAVKTAIREKEAAAKVDAKDKVDQLLQYWELYLSDSTAFRAAVDRKIDWLEQKISRLRSSQGEQDPKDQAEPTTSWFQQIWNVVGSYGKRERLRRIKLAMQDLRETTDQQVAVLAMEVHVADELSSLEVKLQ